VRDRSDEPDHDDRSAPSRHRHRDVTDLDAYDRSECGARAGTRSTASHVVPTGTRANGNEWRAWRELAL